jgi:hypothetical protein
MGAKGLMRYPIRQVAFYVERHNKSFEKVLK